MSAGKIRNILISSTDIDQIFDIFPGLFCQCKKRKMDYSWATWSRLDTWISSKDCHTIAPTLCSHWSDWTKHCSKYYMPFWLSIQKPGGVGDDLNWSMRNQRWDFGSKWSIEKGDANGLKSQCDRRSVTWQLDTRWINLIKQNDIFQPSIYASQTLMCQFCLLSNFFYGSSPADSSGLLLWSMPYLVQLGVICKEVRQLN